MNDIISALRTLDEALASCSRAAFEEDEICDLPDADIVALLAVTGRLQRRLEGLQVETAAQVREHSAALREDRLCLSFGRARPADLLRILLRVDARSASRLLQAEGLVQRRQSLTEGGLLRADYEQLRHAMVAGDLGADGVLAAAGPLEATRTQIADEDRVDTDARLFAFARGGIPRSGTTLSVTPMRSPMRRARCPRRKISLR